MMSADNHFDGERVFVTGATCPVGVELCRMLVARGAVVTALVRDPDKAREYLRNVTVVVGHCERPQEYEEELRSCHHIIHVAGMTHAACVIRAAAGHEELQRVVFISSARVHYPQSTLTRAEKSLNEVLLREEEAITSSRLPWTILRPTLIFARRDRSLSRVASRIDGGRFVPLPGRGKAIKQPISARDLAASIVKAMESPSALRESYDVPGCAVTVREMIDEIGRALSRAARCVSVPRLPVAAARIFFAWNKPVAAKLTGYLRWYSDFELSDEKARVDFGHAPEPFSVNIRRQLTSIAGKGS